MNGITTVPSVDGTCWRRVRFGLGVAELLSREHVVAVAYLCIWSIGAEGVSTKEVVVENSCFGRTHVVVAEVIVCLFSLSELPAEASAIVAVAGRKSDMETDLVTVTFQPVEVHLRVKNLTVTWERLFVVSYKSRIND